MEDREEQRLQREEPGAFLPILPTSRPKRRSPGLGGCLPQRRTRPAPAPAFASRNSGLDGGLLGCCARFWATRSRVQRKEARSHLSIGPKLTLCFPSSPLLPHLSSPLQFHELFLLLLLPTLQGDIPVELFLLCRWLS